jgi:hypothetical protein
MRTRLLFLLASLLPGGFLFSQHPEGIWQVDSINLEDVKGPYISVLLDIDQVMDPATQRNIAVYNAIVVTGNYAPGLQEYRIQRLRVTNKFLRDENMQLVRFYSWTDALNAFYARGWKLSGVINSQFGGDAISNTSEPWFIFEKIPRP